MHEDLTLTTRHSYGFALATVLIKRIVLICSFFLPFSGMSFAQIKILEKAPAKTEQSKPPVFDGSVNFVGRNVDLYKGQTLFANSAHSKTFAYMGFFLDYRKVAGSMAYIETHEKADLCKNVYGLQPESTPDSGRPPCSPDRPHSKYDLLVGR
jgi:hypothetical protein